MRKFVDKLTAFTYEHTINKHDNVLIDRLGKTLQQRQRDMLGHVHDLVSNSNKYCSINCTFSNLINQF